jgi:hypothetical protein
MSNQIFRQSVPDKLLFNLLDKVCLKTDKYYLVDMNAFRKTVFHNYYEEFRNDLMDYYHIGKQSYLTRPLSYKSFTNIIRQICKSLSIMFTSQMKYNESTYNIVYFIYF